MSRQILDTRSTPPPTNNGNSIGMEMFTELRVLGQFRVPAVLHSVFDLKLRRFCMGTKKFTHPLSEFSGGKARETGI